MKNDPDAVKDAFALNSFLGTDDDPGDEVSSLVVGYAWVARITAYSAEFAVLVWFGWFLDRSYGWSPIGILSGVVVGVIAFVAGLIATARRLEDEEVRERLRQLGSKKKR